MSKKLHHYAVFLRTRRGTVRRNVALSERSVTKAARIAQDAVSRHARERVQVMDTVPMRERKGKASPMTLRPRSRYPITVTKTQFVLARKPRARVSAILTPKGVRALPKAQPYSEYESPTSKLSDRNSRPAAPGCTNKACIARGHCGHKLAPGEQRHCYEATIAVGSGHAMLRVFAADAASARALMRAHLKGAGLGHKRIAKLDRNPLPQPTRTLRGQEFVKFA